MRKYFFLIIFGIFCGIAINYVGNKDISFNSLTTDSTWSSYNYKLYDQIFDGNIDLNAIVSREKMKNTDKNSVFRLVLSYRDSKNYTAIDFVNNKISLKQVATGLIVNEKTKYFDRKHPLFDKDNLKTNLQIRFQDSTIKIINKNKTVTAFRNIKLKKGKAGAGVKDNNLILKDLQIIRINPINFRDDFMRRIKDSSPWNSSSKEWSIQSIENPSRSSNAFVYSCSSSNGSTSVIGKPYWDNYEVSTSFFGSRKTQAGIVFSQKDYNNYLMFRWSAKQTTPIKKSQQQTAKKKNWCVFFTRQVRDGSGSRWY